MKAFHNDESVKQKYVDRVEHHMAADNLTRGTGWEEGKGCAVGCTLENYDHDRYESELGIPAWLAHLEDWMFETMPIEDSMTWPKRFLEAIPVGFDDWNYVWHKLSIYLLKDDDEAAIKHAVGDGLLLSLLLQNASQMLSSRYFRNTRRSQWMSS